MHKKYCLYKCTFLFSRIHTVYMLEGKLRNLHCICIQHCNFEMKSTATAVSLCVSVLLNLKRVSLFAILLECPENIPVRMHMYTRCRHLQNDDLRMNE